MVRIKRAYEPAERGDGRRVLVDRLWPRGVRKDRAALHLWARDLAPSAALRTWFGHQPARFDEFARRYRTELHRGPARDLLRRLSRFATEGMVTLVYGARDEAHNNAVVVRDVLRQMARAASVQEAIRPRTSPARKGPGSAMRARASRSLPKTPQQTTPRTRPSAR